MHGTLRLEMPRVYPEIIVVLELPNYQTLKAKRHEGFRADKSLEIASCLYASISVGVYIEMAVCQ